MDQPVGCGHRHRFIHEDIAPCAERMIAGYHQTATLIAVCDQLEQHARFSIVPFDITKVVYHYHAVAIQLQQQFIQFQLCPRFLNPLQLGALTWPDDFVDLYRLYERKAKHQRSHAVAGET